MGSREFEEFLKIIQEERDQYKAMDFFDENPKVVKHLWKRKKVFVKGSSALHYAALNGFTDLIKVLLNKGADLNSNKAKTYGTPLAWAVNSGIVEIVRFLIVKGAEINLDIGKGYNALHLAALGGKYNGEKHLDEFLAIATMLIEAGIDINKRAKGKTPLDLALEIENKKIIKILQDNKALSS